MRLSTLLVLTLPCFVAAQDQIPLVDRAKSWLNAAKAYVPSPPENPVDNVAANIAEKRVHKFTMTNFERKLKPTFTNPEDGPEEWLILVSGGNKTCFGRCGGIEEAWNRSVALFSTVPNSPKLGYINCDRQSQLCTTWAAAIPALYLFQLPIVAAGEPQQRTPLYIIPLNTSTTTTQDITKVIATRDYTEAQRYEGYFHPINGELAVFGLLKPLGYVMWGFSQVPSVVIMVLISFVSRNIMTRRATSQAGGSGAPAAPPPGAPKPASAKK